MDVKVTRALEIPEEVREELTPTRPGKRLWPLTLDTTTKNVVVVDEDREGC